MPPPPPVATDEPAAAVDDVTVRAADLVLDAAGEYDAWFCTLASGIEGHPRAVDRLVRAAGLRDLEPGERVGALVRLDLCASLMVVRGVARRHRRRVEDHLRQDEARSRADDGRGVRPALRRGLGARAEASRRLVRAWMAGEE